MKWSQLLKEALKLMRFQEAAAKVLNLPAHNFWVAAGGTFEAHYRLVNGGGTKNEATPHVEAWASFVSFNSLAGEFAHLATTRICSDLAICPTLLDCVALSVRTPDTRLDIWGISSAGDYWQKLIVNNLKSKQVSLLWVDQKNKNSFFCQTADISCHFAFANANKQQRDPENGGLITLQRHASSCHSLWRRGTLCKSSLRLPHPGGKKWFHHGREIYYSDWRKGGISPRPPSFPPPPVPPRAAKRLERDDLSPLDWKGEGAFSQFSSSL